MTGERTRRLPWFGRTFQIALAVGLGSVVATACGSSSGSSGSSSGGSASAGPVKVMVLGSLQSQALSAPGILYGVTAGADEINAAGGLGGHKVVVVSCNDQLDINQASACARQAVSDKVLASVGSLTIYGDAVVPILKAAGIPDVAPYPLSPLE